jgi:predicted nuclease of predicted toxin-antitoxin system
VKVLLDECLPRYLKRALAGHEVQTVQESGWSGLKNGELLNLAESRFDVFLTSDQNLRYQQNLAGRRIAIVELPTSTLSTVQVLVPQILSALEAARPGDYLPVKGP